MRIITLFIFLILMISAGLLIASILKDLIFETDREYFVFYVVFILLGVVAFVLATFAFVTILFMGVQP